MKKVCGSLEHKKSEGRFFLLVSTNQYRCVVCSIFVPSPSFSSIIRILLLGWWWVYSRRKRWWWCWVGWFLGQYIKVNSFVNNNFVWKNVQCVLSQIAIRGGGLGFVMFFDVAVVMVVMYKGIQQASYYFHHYCVFVRFNHFTYGSFHDVECRCSGWFGFRQNNNYDFWDFTPYLNDLVMG